MSLDTKVERLEDLTVDVLVEFLTDREPDKALMERARVAQGAFGSIQRRLSAQNQRDALAFMMAREGLVPRRVGARSGGETSS